MTAEATRDDLITAIREELVDLWSDFDDAVKFSMVRNLDPLNERSGWSMKMSGIADRIGALTKLVGPIGWEQVSVDLLLDGWWRVIYERVGLDAPPFDAARAQAVKDQRT